MGTLIDYQTDRGVALITLNDPPVNSYTYEMLNELDGCTTDARFDDNVHVVVITGHGDYFFSAGANINMLREVDPEFRYQFYQHASETFQRLERTSKLVIAALNGHAVGGGLEIALACDLRVARAGEGCLGLSQVELGIMPGAGGVHRLVHTVGKARAMQMLLEGTKLGFEEALKVGLLNHVWECESGSAFVDRVMEYAHQFAVPAKAPIAVGRIKRAVQAAVDLTIAESTAFELELQAQLSRTVDASEGIAAWTEKRTPQFQGR